MAPGILYEDDYPLLSRVEDVAHLPPSVCGDFVWDGADLQGADYTWQLTSADIEEVDRALAIFKSYELDGPDISPETFPLPTLGRKLETLAIEVHNGRGFVVISGPDTDLHSAEDNALVFLGLSSYVGSERGMQDNKGRMMVHVYDRGNSANRGAKASNMPSPFHTELSCDVLSLYVKSEPATGGTLKIASSWQVYNDLYQARPDIIQTLSAPNWAFESRGDLFPAQTRRLLFVHDKKVILNFSRRPLLGSQPEADTGILTGTQKEALQLVQEAASQRCLKLTPQKGSIVFINNLAMLHSRDGFIDDLTHTRHLLRLWLRNPSLAWSLPEELVAGHRRVYGEDGRAERWEFSPAETVRGSRWRRNRTTDDGQDSGEETSGNETNPSSTSH